MPIIELEEADFKKQLAFLADKLRSIGRALHQREDLAPACRIAFSTIAEATAGQLDLLGRNFREPIEITANVCRITFEINVVLRYCLSSAKHLEGYLAQAGTDEISIYKAIKELRNDDTKSMNLIAIDQRIKHLRDVLQKHGMTLKPDRVSYSFMAEAVGLKSEYEALYGLYSKYVHASVWFVIRPRKDIDLPIFRYRLIRLTAVAPICRIQGLWKITLRR